MDATVDWPRLRAAATEVMRQAYAPYSGFPVGAAALVDDGRIVALSCVDGNGERLMPCGRCRQLLWEHGGPQCLVDAVDGPLRMVELLPHAFGPADLEAFARTDRVDVVPDRMRRFRGRGTVFVHPDVAGGERVWTAYWERSSGFTDDPMAERGILEEGPTWPTARTAVSWGLARTPRVVVVDGDGGLTWAGTEEPPPQVPRRWKDE